MKNILKLIKIGSNPLGGTGAALDPALLRRHGDLAAELQEVLALKNGFYAFESALHLWPASPCDTELGLADWNAEHLWRGEYAALAQDMLFFAEDAFGNQFCLHKQRVCSFDAETGEVVVKGRSLEEWAGRVLADYEVETGYPLIHEWQQQNGALPAGQRLLPKLPFVLGGKYELANLHALDAVKGMRWRGSIAVQIKDLPDGAQIHLNIKNW